MRILRSTHWSSTQRFFNSRSRWDSSINKFMVDQDKILFRVSHQSIDLTGKLNNVRSMNLSANEQNANLISKHAVFWHFLQIDRSIWSKILRKLLRRENQNKTRRQFVTRFWNNLFDFLEIVFQQISRINGARIFVRSFERAKSGFSSFAMLKKLFLVKFCTKTKIFDFLATLKIWALLFLYENNNDRQF